MKIEGKVALVTGGARGLGFAIAEKLKSQGATVVIFDKDVAARIGTEDSYHFHEIDVVDSHQVQAGVAAINSTLGPVEILVNNAGIIYNEPLVNMLNPDNMMHDLNHFRACISVNLESVFVVTSCVVAQMVRQRIKGSITNVSSISSRGNAGQTAYSAAKAGVEAMTRTWSKELGRLGIRTNAIAPGFIDTLSTRTALTEKHIQHIVLNTPLRRLGLAGEVAQGVASLIENDFLNGVVLNIDGGLTF